MRVVREGIFETNSSSTHSICIVEDSQLEKWKDGKLFYLVGENKFIDNYSADYINQQLYGKILLEQLQYANDTEKSLIIKAINENKIKDFIKERIDTETWYVEIEDKPLTYKEFWDWWDSRELEGDTTTYITPKGEKIHIFCQYGYDG